MKPTLLLIAVLLAGCGPELVSEEVLVDDGGAALVTAVPDLVGLGGTYTRAGLTPLGQIMVCHSLEVTLGWGPDSRRPPSVRSRC